MEVMSPPRPFTERIDSTWTRAAMERKPDGEPCTVRFRWCSAFFVREHHFEGGERTTRHLDHNDELLGQELDVAHPVHGGPAVLRSKSACRGAIGEMLMEVLPALVHKYAGSEDVQFWDEFVPADLVDSIVDGAEGGGSYACDVWMHVEVTRVYGPPSVPGGC